MGVQNIVAREEGQDGKAYWNPIGKLITSKEGKMYVKLNHVPDVMFNVFDIKPKNDNSSHQSQETESPFSKDEDIPF